MRVKAAEDINVDKRASQAWNFAVAPRGVWMTCCGAPGITANDGHLNRPFARAADRERFLDGVAQGGASANRPRVRIWPLADFGRERREVAFGGKADEP